MKSNSKATETLGKKRLRRRPERKERTLVLYRQARVDGGIRTGISIDGLDILETYQMGRAEEDPALLWFVDVRAVGKDLPTDPIKIRDWFLSMAPTLEAAFNELADRVEVGFDCDVMPLQWQVPHAPVGVRIVIVSSVIHRLMGREMAAILRDIGKRWEEIVRSLELIPEWGR